MSTYSILSAILVLSGGLAGRAATVSPLAERGYALLPYPQKVVLGAAEFRFGPDWTLEAGPGVQPGDDAIESLKELLAGRHHLTLKGQAAQPRVIRLSLRNDAVVLDENIPNRSELARQAYRMDLSESEIRLAANAPAGLFYAVETLVQLLKKQDGELWLPEGEIVDWPDLPSRFIYWDDAHHLERFSELKRAVRQAAFFKINGFVIKLEGHFQFKSAPALVEPYALTPAQLQELTDYGLRYHVQVIPYLDAPAHIAFILKHPEYAKLRSFPRSNYELCTTNPDSYKLLLGMFQDLLDANKGVTYFYLSTDEPYYVGLAKNAQCDEVAAAKNLGGVGRLLAEFITKTADYLHERGRTVLFWGEFPLKLADIKFLPSHLVNGEVLDPSFNRAFHAQGIRQMIFTSTEGEEMLFPSYYARSDSRRLHAAISSERVPEQFEKISFDPSRELGHVIGEINCGWADSGLHPETFWLGYATSAAAGWHAGVPDAREAMSMFHVLFYGPGAANMEQVYQLLSLQARFWEDSWEVTKSKWRKPIFGWSYGVFDPPRTEDDPTLPLPSVPVLGSRTQGPSWQEKNAERLQLAGQFLSENDELLGLLHGDLQRAEFNRYNLEVLVAVTRLCRQNLEMLGGLGRMAADLKQAQAAAAAKRTADVLSSLDRALETAVAIRDQRNQVLRDATATWYKSWQPRVAEANGWRFLHELDDVKDHLPDRTVDMSYLVYREMILPFGEWVGKIQAVRNDYARRHGLPLREESFDWMELVPAR
jgi:hexosaminidase